jgi:hypothetical protein
MGGEGVCSAIETATISRPQVDYNFTMDRTRDKGVSTGALSIDGGGAAARRAGRPAQGPVESDRARRHRIGRELSKQVLSLSADCHQLLTEALRVNT